MKVAAASCIHDWIKHQFILSGNDRWNSSVFNRLLNIASEEVDVTWAGKLFQARAAATGNARSPIEECFVPGTTRASVVMDLSWRCALASALRLSVELRYGGACPAWQRNAITASRNVMRSGIRSQWRSRSSGVTWSYFRADSTSRAAAFNTDWSLFNCEIGRPTKVAQP